MIPFDGRLCRRCADVVQGALQNLYRPSEVVQRGCATYYVGYTSAQPPLSRCFEKSFPGGNAEGCAGKAQSVDAAIVLAAASPDEPGKPCGDPALVGA